MMENSTLYADTMSIIERYRSRNLEFGTAEDLLVHLCGYSHSAAIGLLSHVKREGEKLDNPDGKSDSEKWFELVRKVRRALNHDQYEDWQFMVGNNDSPDVRYKDGVRALDAIRPGYGRILSLTAADATTGGSA